MAGVQCCENPPVLDPASGHGSVVDDFGGLKAYTSGSPDFKLAIVLIADIYGYEAPNLRKLADKVADAGFFVVVPDFFYGDPFYGDPYVPASSRTPITEWIQAHGTDKGFDDAKHVITALKNNGVSAIGAAGFCWGAKVVAELAKSDYINAAVMLHPSMVTVDDIKAIKTHIAVLGAEIDKTAPPELVKQFDEVLSVKSEFKIEQTGVKNHVEKLEKFKGVDFKCWQQKLLFYLTTLNLAHVIKEEVPVANGSNISAVQLKDQLNAIDVWTHYEFLCRNYILNGLDDSLYDVYASYKTVKELWESLEKKYKSEVAVQRSLLLVNF